MGLMTEKDKRVIHVPSVKYRLEVGGAVSQLIHFMKA